MANTADVSPILGQVYTDYLRRELIKHAAFMEMFPPSPPRKYEQEELDLMEVDAILGDEYPYSGGLLSRLRWPG